MLRAANRCYASVGKGAVGALRRCYSESVTVNNPFTGETAATVQLASASEAKALLGRSEAAQQQWKDVPLEQRVETCRKFMDALAADEAVPLNISKQMGKPLHYAMGEIKGAAERVHAMADLAPSVLADEVIPMAEGQSGFRQITREPVGVVLSIAPWNFPLLTAVNSVIPAVLAGNSVVVKHSERTPLCGDDIARAFTTAGAPEGLVTSLHSSHELTSSVIQDPRIGFVSFTGSVRGGHAIYQSVAKSRFIDATLELGGKDPAYVAEDADLAAAVETLVDGAFFNSGQSCCGIERVYVHQSLYQKFVEGAKAAIEAYVLGDPMDKNTTLGPMAQPSAVDFLQGQVDEAKRKGATLVTGGRKDLGDTGKAQFFLPTLLSDCTHDMSAMKDESFGPLLAVSPVASDEEALEKMNDSEYGLTACVFTKDKERALRMGKGLQCGTVFMNRCDYLDPLLPWTGVKNTGKGVSLSRHGFDGVTKLKGYNFRF